MTWEEREEIFAKEILCGADIQKLHNCSPGTASKIIQKVKKFSDRLKIGGIIHIQDYLDCFNLSIERYAMPRRKKAYEYDFNDTENDKIVELLQAIVIRLSDEQLGQIMQTRHNLIRSSK